MNRDDIETLQEVCYQLRAYINRIYGPDVHHTQQQDYQREMQLVEDALEIINNLKEANNAHN